MSSLTEKLHAGGFIVSEANGFLSREKVLFALGTTVIAGQILALTGGNMSASSAAKAGGNTGNGVLTLDVATPVIGGAKAGVYTVRCVTAASNSGTFRVEDPDGNVVGDVVVGATFSDDIKFVISDGAADYIVGDGFDITVTTSGKQIWKAFSPAGNDGSELAAGVAFADVDASTGQVEGVALVRSCEVRASDLTWPAGITAAQKASAISRLEQRQIALR